MSSSWRTNGSVEDLVEVSADVKSSVKSIAIFSPSVLSTDAGSFGFIGVQLLKYDDVIVLLQTGVDTFVG